MKIVVLSVFVSMRVVCEIFGGQSGATEVVKLHEAVGEGLT